MGCQGLAGQNACRGHIIVSPVMARNIFSVAAGGWLVTDGNIAAAISILQYPFCVGVGDSWGYRSSILHDCDIDIAAAIPILESPVWYRGWAFVQEYV